jgi:integrase
MIWLAAGETLDCETLPKYVEALRARSLSATTVAWRASVVASFLKDANRQGVLDRDLTEGYRLPRGTKGAVPRVLSQCELKRLLRTPDQRSWRGRRDLAVIALMALAGMRVGEVTRLRLCDIALQPDRVEIRVRGKGDRVRRVAIAGRNASPIRAWAKVRGTGHAGAPFFITKTSEDGEPRAMSIAQLDYVVRKLGRAAEIDGLHCHCLRHTCASLAIGNGVNLVAIRDLLGHGSILTTSRYLHATGSAITTAVTV